MIQQQLNVQVKHFAKKSSTLNTSENDDQATTQRQITCQGYKLISIARTTFVHLCTCKIPKIQKSKHKIWCKLARKLRKSGKYKEAKWISLHQL